MVPTAGPAHTAAMVHTTAAVNTAAQVQTAAMVNTAARVQAAAPVHMAVTAVHTAAAVKAAAPVETIATVHTAATVNAAAPVHIVVTVGHTVATVKAASPVETVTMVPTITPVDSSMPENARLADHPLVTTPGQTSRMKYVEVKLSETNEGCLDMLYDMWTGCTKLPPDIHSRNSSMTEVIVDIAACHCPLHHRTSWLRLDPDRERVVLHQHAAAALLPLLAGETVLHQHGATLPVLIMACK